MRKTLFFQVEKDTSHSEPIILNAEFLDNINDETRMYLGFGKRANNSVYPNTDIYTMPLNRKTFSILYKWLVSRLVLYIPGFLRKKIRKFYNIPSNK